MTDDQSDAGVLRGRENNQKGQRNEREAANILARVYGKGNVDKVDAYSNSDPLGFVDVLASKENWPVRFVQVKTNQVTAKDRRRYASKASRMSEGVICEVWVRVDYEGWLMYRYDRDAGEWDRFLSMDTCDTEETVEAFREAVGYYEVVSA